MTETIRPVQIHVVGKNGSQPAFDVEIKDGACYSCDG